jgi:hypothetical protein
VYPIDMRNIKMSVLVASTFSQRIQSEIELMMGLPYCRKLKGDFPLHFKEEGLRSAIISAAENNLAN